MIKTFLEAAIPEPVACCLIRLEPFSLGHYLLLKKFCPSYLDGDNHDIGDLITSCLICSQTYQKTIEDFSGVGSDVGAKLKEWGERIEQDKTFNFVVSSNLFKRYIARGLSFPVVSSEASSDSKTDPSLWPMLTLVGCMSKLGQSRDEVFDQPLPLSRWLVAGFGTLEGAVTIVDPISLDERQKEADEFDAKFRAKGGE